MTEPSLRLKVTDFLATDFEQEVFQELMKLKQLNYMGGLMVFAMLSTFSFTHLIYIFFPQSFF